MALKYIPPVKRRGGRQISEGLSRGIQQAGNSLADALKEEKEKSFTREMYIQSMMNKIDPVSSISRKHHERADAMIGGLQDYIRDTTKKSRKQILLQGKYSSEDAININSYINAVKNEIERMKKENETVLGWNKTFNGKPGEYNPIHFNRAMDMYINGRLNPVTGEREEVSLQEIGPFLREAPVNLFVKGMNTPKPPTGGQSKTKIINGKEVTVTEWADDREKIGMFTNDFSTPGGQDWTTGVFYGDIPDLIAPKTDEERAPYIREAEAAHSQGKTMFGSPALYAAYLWGVDNIAPSYLQDTRAEEPVKLDKPKEKTVIEPTGDIWTMYDKPVKLTGYEGAKTTNVVELIYGSPREDLEEGLYFKVFKTSSRGQQRLDQAGGDRTAIEQLAAILSPDDYETDYIPYNKIAGDVEKTYKFKGIEGYKGRQKVETEERVTKDGRRAIFNKKNKEFIKWKDE